MAFQEDDAERLRRIFEARPDIPLEEKIAALRRHYAGGPLGLPPIGNPSGLDPSGVPYFEVAPYKDPAEERAFQERYRAIAAANNLDPNPDAREHQYDYRRALAAGATPGPDQHWPSEFKLAMHPNRYVDGVDTAAPEKPDPPPPSLWEGVGRALEDSMGPLAPALGELQRGISTSTAPLFRAYGAAKAGFPDDNTDLSSVSARAKALTDAIFAGPAEVVRSGPATTVALAGSVLPAVAAGAGNIGGRLALMQPEARAAWTQEAAQGARALQEPILGAADRALASVGLRTRADVEPQAAGEAAFGKATAADVVDKAKLAATVMENVDLLMAAGLAEGAARAAVSAAKAAGAAGESAVRATAARALAAHEQRAFVGAVLADPKPVVPVEQAADFIDSVLNTQRVKNGVDPLNLAGSIQSNGLDRAAKIHLLSPEETEAIRVAMGDKRPSDFVRTLGAFKERQAQVGSEVRQQAVAGYGFSGDGHTEVNLVAQGARPVGLVTQPIEGDAAALAKASGLKMMRIDGALKGAEQPKGWNGLHVVYDPDLVEALHQGVKTAVDPLVAAKAGAFESGVDWLKTLIRRDPATLQELGSGGLFGKYPAGGTLELTAGGEVLHAFPVERGTDLSTEARRLLNAVKPRGTPGIEPLPEKVMNSIAEKLSKLGGKEPYSGPFGIRVTGRPIEAAAAKAGIPEAEDFLPVRLAQGGLRNLGLEHDEATNLIAAAMGKHTPQQAEAVAQQMTDAARALVARGKVATLEEARAGIVQNLEAARAMMPEEAKFWTGAQAKEVAAAGAPPPPSVETPPTAPAPLTPEIAAAMEADSAAHEAGAAVAQAHKKWTGIQGKLKELMARFQAATTDAERGAIDAEVQKLGAESEAAKGEMLKAFEATQATPAAETGVHPPELEAHVRSTDWDHAQEARDLGLTPEEAAKRAEAAKQPTFTGKPGHGGPDDPSVPKGYDIFGADDIRSAMLEPFDRLKFHMRSDPIRALMHSPQGMLQDLGMVGKQAWRAWVDSFMRRQSFIDEGEFLSKVRRSTLSNRTDQNLAGALVEGDLKYIQDAPGGQAWLDEVLANETPRAKAVNEYMRLFDEASRRLAEHARIPWSRRLKDWFGHYEEATQRFGPKLRPYELSDWEANQIPKEAFYGPLEERNNVITNYMRNPEDMLRVADAMAARYRMLDDLLPLYDKMIERADPVLKGVLTDSKKLLTEPRSQGDTRFRRWVTYHLSDVYGKVASKALPPDLVPRAVSFLKQSALLSKLGLNVKTGIVNLSTLPLHTALRVGWTDMAIGQAEFLKDVMLSAKPARSLPFGVGNLAQRAGLGRQLPSELWAAFEDSHAAGSHKHLDIDLERTPLSKAASAATAPIKEVRDALLVAFQGTEYENRGVTFYAEARRALKALDEVRAGKPLPEWAYDGFIAPTNDELLGNLSLLRSKLSGLEEAAAKGEKAYLKGEDLNLAPGEVTPEEMSRVKAILDGPGHDLDKARAIFKAEEEARAAAGGGDPIAFAKAKGQQAVVETQFLYTKQNRPKFIVRNAVADVLFQFQDFMRQEFEFFARLPWVKTVKIGGQVNRIPGPALQFLGMLTAAGGPRAWPYVQEAMDIYGMADPKKKAELEVALDDLSKGRYTPATPGLRSGTDLIGWTGYDVANSIRLGVAVPHANFNPYPGASAPVQAISGMGGPLLGPVIGSGVAPIGAATQVVAGLRDRGMDPEVAPAAAVQAQQFGLRQEVPAQGLLGAAVKSQAGRSVLNVPSTIAGAVGLDTASEALRFKEGERPGTISIPGEVPLSNFTALKQLATAAQASTGVKKAKGKPTAVIAKERGILDALGFAPYAPTAERHQLDAFGERAKETDAGHKAFLDYLLATNPGAMPTEMQKKAADAGHYVSTQEVRDKIAASGNDVFTRQGATFSKRAAADLLRNTDYADRLEALDAQNPRETPEQQAVGLGMDELRITTLRRAFGSVNDQSEATGEPVSMNFRAKLLSQYKATKDAGLYKELLRATSNAHRSPDGTFRPDPEMLRLHEAARQGPDAIQEMARRLARGDDKKEAQLVAIGLWLMNPAPPDGTSGEATP